MPASAFERTGDDQPFTATVTATFIAIDDGNAEASEDFAISVERGAGAQESISLPNALTLTIPRNDFPEFSVRSLHPADTPPTENVGSIEFEVTRDWTATSTTRLQVRVSDSGRMIHPRWNKTRTINMAPTATSARIRVPIRSNPIYQPHSTITAEILDGDGHMASPTSGSAQVIVQDDDFNYRVRLSVGADRTTLSEGQSVTLTFTFKTRHHREPHSDSGTLLINVTGDADDYSLSTTTFSAPQSTFMSTRDERHYVATSVVTFTAAVDDATEPEEQFTLSVTRGEGKYASTELPGALTLTIVGTGPPDAPLSVAAEPAGTGEIDVSWQEPGADGGSAITGYAVQWKEVSGSWDTPDDVSEAVTTDTTYTITGLSPGVEYSVRVVATNSGGKRDGLRGNPGEGE